jgi:hypothetical protein
MTRMTVIAPVMLYAVMLYVVVKTFSR